MTFLEKLLGFLGMMPEASPVQVRATRRREFWEKRP